MALTSSNAVKQLSDQNSQGTVFGASATDTIAFYGSDPAAQATILSGTALSTATGSTGAFGYGNAFTASSIAHAVQRLVTMGLIG